MSRIVVGVDGSDRGFAALRWAFAEAALRGWPVVAVHAYRTPVAGFEYGRVLVPGPAVDVEPAARELLDEQLRRARHVADTAAGVVVEPVVAEGGAASVLIETAAARLDQRTGRAARVVPGRRRPLIEPGSPATW